jgi:ketosteroid isomerase-like protein
MTTKQTIEEYFHALSRGEGWQAFLADQMTFTSYTSPIKQVAGKDAYLESTRGFYSMIESFEVRRLLVDGDRACVSTRYSLAPPRGDSFTCDVAELFEVRDDKIDSFEIYFDSAPFSTAP